MRIFVPRFTRVCVVALLLLGFMPPAARCPHAYTTVILGDIASTASAEEGVRVVSAIALEDINGFMEDYDYPYRFEAKITNANGQAAAHLEQVQGLYSIGVKLLIGGPWSSMAQASLGYCNDNDVLMLSAGSTSPVLAITGDNLFRVSGTDLIDAPPIVETILSYGVDAVIVVQRADSWADGIINAFEAEYTARGGTIIDKVRYAGEATEFSNYLYTIDDVAADAVASYGYDRVGVLVLSFSEIITMVIQSQDYPTISDLTWFGAYATYSVADDAPEQAARLKLISPERVAPDTAEFTEFSRRFELEMGYEPSYWDACHYDAYWLYALAVTASGSTDPMVVKETLPLIAEEFWGVSGHCAFNEAGDRAAASYLIMGVVQTGSVTEYRRLGFYDDYTGIITWDDAVVSLPESYSVQVVQSTSNSLDATQADLMVRVVDAYGNPVYGEPVYFYLENRLVGDSLTDSDGYAQVSAPIGYSSHSWYALVSDDSGTYLSREAVVSLRSTRYVNVVSDYGATSGTGDYSDGDSVTISVSPDPVVTDDGVKHVFKAWQCESGNGYWGEENPHTMMVNGDVTQVATWDTKYYVDIVADKGEVSPSSGWYDAGTLLKIKAVSTSNLLFSTTFEGWSGDYVSGNNIVLVPVNGPMIIVANWTNDYTRAYGYGFIVAASVAVIGYRSRKKRLAVETEERRDSMLRNDILTADGVIDVEEVAARYKLKGDAVKSVIEEYVAAGRLEGMYSKDGKKFVTTSHIRDVIKDRL
ncbi:ABC transporter substrate-binding protein [Candidatus Bathyarchaeota archaeon]|nr:ABC transporter substrate-binding protein [Candidatus Bathyarchaeota archaeon]